MADWVVTTGADPFANGAELQDIWDNFADCGDRIILEAGSAYQAESDYGILIREKSCSGNPIIIESDAIGQLPENTRVTSASAVHMPKIWCGFLDFIPTVSWPALSVGKNLSGVIIRGIEFSIDTGMPYANNIVYMGNSPGGVTLAEHPTEIIFDRCYIHSLEDETDEIHGTAGTGLQLAGYNVTIKNSRISCPAGMYPLPSMGVNNQYAVQIAQGGNFTVHNNFLSAWYAVMFSGGFQTSGYQEATLSSADMDSATFSNVTGLNIGDLASLKQDSTYWGAVQITGISGNDVTYEPYSTTIGLYGSPLTATPEMPGGARWEGENAYNIVITRNTFYVNPVIEQDIFDLTGGHSKGIFEFKVGDGMTLEGNDFTGYIGSMTFWNANQGTASGAWSVWNTFRNVIFRNNRLIANGVFRLIIQPEDNYQTSTPGSNFLFENNLWATAGGGWVDFQGGSDVRFIHNTMLTHITAFNSNTFTQNTIPTTDFEFRDNIFVDVGNGFACSGVASTCFDQLISDMLGNVIIEETAPPDCPYPAGNSCVDDIAEVGFDVNYALAAASPFKGTATDNTDPGVDYNALLIALGVSDGRKTKKGRVIRGRH